MTHWVHKIVGKRIGIDLNHSPNRFLQWPITAFIALWTLTHMHTIKPSLDICGLVLWHKSLLHFPLSYFYFNICVCLKDNRTCLIFGWKYSIIKWLTLSFATFERTSPVPAYPCSKTVKIEPKDFNHTNLIKLRRGEIKYFELFFLSFSTFNCVKVIWLEFGLRFVIRPEGSESIGIADI